MNCREVRDNLDDGRAGRLRPEAAAALREHLAVCVDCALHAAAGVPAVSEEEWAALGARVRDRLPRERVPLAVAARRRVFWWMEAAGVAAAALMVAVLAGTRGSEPRPLSSVRSVAAAPGWSVSVRVPHEPGGAVVISVIPGRARPAAPDRNGDSPDML